MPKHRSPGRFSSARCAVSVMPAQFDYAKRQNPSSMNRTILLSLSPFCQYSMVSARVTPVNSTQARAVFFPLQR